MSNSHDDLKQVSETAKRTLVKMAQLEIPLTPENYHVWFTYFMGTDKKLTEQMDRLMSSGRPFDAETNAHLYREYTESEGEKEIISEIHAQTWNMLKSVFDEVLATDASTSQYTEKLKGYSQKLSGARQLSQIAQLIKDLIEDTEQMAESSGALQKKLQEATALTERLKEKLDETRKEVMKDALTGLYNRRALDQKLASLHEEFGKEGRIFSVIMLDIDFFKAFNDKYGHKIGDEVLKKVGETLYERLKGSDFSARYGGEEFVVILPQTKLENACIVAEQLRKGICEKKLRRVKTGESLGSVTVSLGVSQVHPEDTIGSLMERADKALYLAKNSGRNNSKSEMDLP